MIERRLLMDNIRIGHRKVGLNEPAFIVAEIGINHNGSVDIAKKLIDAAVNAGCEAVKFQKRTVDVVYSAEELSKPRESVFGITNGDLKRGLEFGEREYFEIDKYCKEKNIIWFASPWDIESVDFIDRFNLPCYKISSASLTDDELLNHTISKGKPIILSTGMSTMEEIEHAVEILSNHDLILMHSVSTYPTDDNELELKVISTLQDRFPDIPIGYSGHEHGTTMSVCARALGACVIERHITLDRTMWGSDHSASIEPKGFELMISNIRRLEKAFGDGIKKVLDSEKPVLQKLRKSKKI